MNRIQQVSRYFRILFQISFLITLLAQIIIWSNAPGSLTMLQSSGAQLIPNDYTSHILVNYFSPTTRLLGFLINMIPTGFELLIIYFLIKLFKQFEQNEIFSPSNVRYIRNIGYALLFGQLVQPIYQSLIGILLTSSNPPHQHFFSITFGTDNIRIMIGAGIIILVSWIMAEAQKLREEQQLTI